MRTLIKLIITLLLLNISIQPAYAVTEGTDEVSLRKPTAGSTVSGKYNLEWVISDTEIDEPAYFVDVFNLACSEAGGNLGRITDNGAQRDGNIYKYEWDTVAGEFSGVLRDQGNYCMRVCGILANGGSVYSLCDKQSFVYSLQQTGNNKPPVIQSDQKTFDISLNQVFSFKISATDPDGDPLTYSLVSSPDFMSIDAASGLISGKPTEVGNLRFIVNADDKKGGIDSEEFVLNVLSEQSSDEVKFLFPSSNSTLTSVNNTIEWDIRSGIQVKSIVLSYSKDKKEWVELSRIDRNLEKYTWDIASLEETDYYLRIQLTDSSNSLFEVISSKFAVKKEGTVSGTNISELQPQEGSTITNKKPVISATFVLPTGVNVAIEQIKFYLDDREDLTVCDKTAQSISCTLAAELAEGVHTVYIEINDTSGATVVKEWSFTISEDGESNSDNKPTINTNTVQLIIIVFAIGFVLIALPWSVYLFIKRRKASQDAPSPTTKLPESTVPVEPPVINTEMKPTKVDNLAIDMDPVAPEMPSNPNLNPFGYDSEEPSVDSDVMATSGVPGQEAPTEGILLDQNLPTSQGVKVNSMNENIPANSTQDSINSYTQTNKEIPRMYAQEEIPEWLQSSTANLPTNNEGTQQTANDKTNVVEGAKVYDPYGLALNPDEVQNHN